MDQFPVASHCAMASHMASLDMVGALAPVLAPVLAPALASVLAALLLVSSFGAGRSLPPMLIFAATGSLTTVGPVSGRLAAAPSTVTVRKVFCSVPAAPSLMVFF